MSVPMEAKELRKATDDADPPEEPPGDNLSGGEEEDEERYGCEFTAGPNAEFVLALPMPNSSMFV